MPKKSSQSLARERRGLTLGAQKEREIQSQNTKRAAPDQLLMMMGLAQKVAWASQQFWSGLAFRAKEKGGRG